MMHTTKGTPAVWPIRHNYIDMMSNTQHWILAETWACAMNKLDACCTYYSYLHSTDATGAYVWDDLD